MATVDLEWIGSVAEIVLNRPEKLNSLDESMARELGKSIEVAQQKQARVLLLRGEGRAFCSGRDISNVDPTAEDAAIILREVFNPLFEAIDAFPCPTIAAVHGVCMGVGLGLALACDVVLVSDDARISSPFARLGAVLDSGGHYHFLKLLGRHRALELIYTGRTLDGRQAEAWGLVNSSVAGKELLGRARQLARQLASGPTAAFRLSKSLLLRAEGLTLTQVLDAEADTQTEASTTADYAEGFRAFQEKRAPEFLGE